MPPADEAQPGLIPGLPDDVASHILALIPYSHHARLRPTSKAWRAFLSPPSVLPLRRRRLRPPSLSHLICLFPQDPSLSPPYLFDPVYSCWAPLPPAPCSPHRYGLSNFSAVSLGPRLFVLGGAYFDARSYPIDRPRPSPAVFSLDLSSPGSPSWARCSPMLAPRSGFACAADPESGVILVAGGGSRHNLFGAGGGTRISAAERYDVGRDMWTAEERMPGVRAGCVGFMVGRDEFWVMGGYGDSSTISGVFPVDEYYMDGVVLDLKSGKWSGIGDMWAYGQRWRLESVVTVDGLEGPARPGIFMLDGDDIFRFEISTNQWWKESTLPRKTPPDCSSSFVALAGELYVMFVLPHPVDSIDYRRSKHKVALFIQVYCPKKKKWRAMITKTPFLSLNFRTTVMCTIKV